MKLARFPRFALLLAGLSLLVAGCVTEIQQPLTQTNLFTARSGDTVALSWASKRGEQYAIWYADSLGSGTQWKPLPGCERIDGTGATIEKTDHLAIGQQRYYRIVTKPAK